MEFLNFGELPALDEHGVLEALGNVAIEILERGVVLKNPALDLEVVDAASEGVGKRLEDKDR